MGSAGDVDNDGFDDVIIGARRYNPAQSSGRAYVFDVHDQDTLHIFSGASGDFFGTAVGPMGDINKDGYDDVLVSAIESDGALIDAGRVFVLSGFNGDTLHAFEGESFLDEFGWSAATAGDVDNDGFNDVIVGAECNSVNGNCAGRVYVFSCCCLGNRGDFNGDGNNSTLLDLNYLVNDIFRGGPSAACAVEADLNDDSNSGTLLDLNFLVNDIFRGGPSAGACY
ncbi:MAG TPA: integrin alpha [candidate division Zixibacteria bacterium]|nr:integrin alpha [candidate division Zixibacteria bacterium]